LAAVFVLVQYFTLAYERATCRVQTCGLILNCFVKDTVIYERLRGDQTLKDVTLTHLEEFASIGWQRTVYSYLSDINICTESI